MRASLEKSIAISLALLTLAVGLASSTTSAEAGIHFGGGGGHFGGGHFGGGHFGGGHFGGGGFGIGFAGGYYGDDSCVRYRPMFDDMGNVIGRHPVNVCY